MAQRESKQTAIHRKQTFYNVLYVQRSYQILQLCVSKQLVRQDVTPRAYSSTVVSASLSLPSSPVQYSELTALFV